MKFKQEWSLSDKAVSESIVIVCVKDSTGYNRKTVTCARQEASLPETKEWTRQREHHERLSQAVIWATGQCNHREKGGGRRSENARFSSCVFHSLLTELTTHSVCPQGSPVPQAVLSCGKEEIPGGRAAPEVHILPPKSLCLLPQPFRGLK